MQPGTTLGPYRIERELGSGGMGKVHAAVIAGRVPGLAEGTRVAVKVVHPHLLETPGFFKRFLREADIGKQVAHENVVRTYDVDALAVGGQQIHFLVMEYVEGQTLRELLAELDRVPEELCRHIGREVARGLEAIHAAGVLHRDIKPENVLITPDHVVKVMDLGVARLQDEVVRLSQTGAFVGSVHYAAPEQFGGAADTDHRADLHALGLLLYELASGQHPYHDEDFRVVLKRLLNEEPRRVAEINPQLSPFLEEVIHTLIAKDREARFATAEELALILEAGESGEWWRERARALRLETKQPLRRVRIIRETSLYGRDAELTSLRALFAQVKAGSGRVLLVEGEAGIGKTRLLDEFVGQLRQAGEDLNFLFSSYPPGGAATAAGAFSTAYREHFGESCLGDTLAEYLPESRILAPALAALLMGDPIADGQEPLTKDSIQTVFVRVTRALAAERPTIVLIDDLHFAPDDGRALFAALAASVAENRVLLVGTMRPGLAEDWVANVERLEHSSYMKVERLFPKDLIRLLEDSLRSKRLAAQLGAQIAVKSDGNPFFAFEIIRGLRDAQFITQELDGSWVSTQVIEQIQIPSSVMDLIQARIADLDEEQRELLDVASCCGFDFDPLLVGETLGMRRIPLLRSLGRIEKSHRLVRSVGVRCVFDHHQVQEALYGALSELLRREYHAALGDALETRSNALENDPKVLDGALCVDLCEHLFKGACGERAVRYLDAALDHLDAGYLNDQVIALADRALEVPDLVTGGRRVELLLRKAERLDILGRLDAEREALDEALLLAEACGDAALRALVRTRLGWLLVCFASYDEAREVLTRALELAREAGDKVIETEAVGNLGTASLHQGRYEEARAHYESRLALARETGSRRDEAAAVGNLGSVFYLQGRFEETREYFERYLELARANGDRLAEVSASGNLANVLFVQGRHGEARPYLERLAARAREIGDRQTEASTLSNLGLVYVPLGRPDLGRERALDALSICREIGTRRVEVAALDALADTEETLGEIDAAEEHYRAALALSREIGQPHSGAGALASLGRLLSSVEGRTDEAVAFMTQAIEATRELGIAGAQVLSRCRLALLGRDDAAAVREALDELADGLFLHERMEARFLLWKATSEPGDLAEAHGELERMRSHATDEYRESMVENVPLHREIVAAWEQHGA